MNSFFEICIRRPVLACVLSIIVLLLGLISYSRLTVREYPQIDEPIVSVQTTYRGASAEVIESQITKPLEDSLSGIPGVEIMTSQSRAERSNINIRFLLSIDPDSAAADVRDKVSRVRGRLPLAIDEPVISKADADSNPMMWIHATSEVFTPMQLADYVNRYIKPRLSVLPGLTDLRIFGNRLPSMRVNVDRDRLAAYNLTVQDVEDALRRQNVEIPSGRIESNMREFSVVSQTDLQSPEQFAAVVVSNRNGHPVHLGDLASVSVGPRDERIIGRFKGNPSINIGVIKQTTANPLDLALGVRAEVSKISENLPPSMQLIIGADDSVFIERSIESVYHTIIEAVVLVSLVIFIFLRNLRATIIPLVTIPVALIGACVLLYAFGFSINTLTLLAIVMAIGLVVDDSIVVLENIYRNIESGMERKAAAMKGIKEIGFAVIAMTLTLAAVYAPLAFATGRTGRLFTEFALALAGAVLVSGFVALTLSPMMCSQLLRHERKHSWLYTRVESFFNKLTQSYASALEGVLKHSSLMLGIWLLVFGAGAVLFLLLKAELAPIEDRGQIAAFVTSPQGATPQYTSENGRRIEELFAKIPEGRVYSATIGNPLPTNMFGILRLVPWENRTRKQQDITRELFPKFQAIPGVNAVPINQASLGQGGASSPIEYVIASQVPYLELEKIVNNFIEEANKVPGIVNFQTDLKLNTPELRVNVNREKLSDLGIPVDTVGRTLETMLGGRQVTRYKADGEEYDVMVQVSPRDRSNPNDISDLYVRARQGDMVQLSNLLDVQEGVSPQSLNHFNRLRAVTITASLGPDLAIGEALDKLDNIAKRTLPPTVQTNLNGQSREFRQSSGNVYLTFLMALAFIYLVLAAQFESFIDPFIIMLSVPLSLTGALLALWLSGGTLNIYSQIGLITLVGLITKHGILIVEFANQLQEQGRPLIAAVREAAVLRLRPILMTTGAMVLGAIPLALATGPGAESRMQIGWVIVGGMSFGTLLTLFIVPTAYKLIARRHKVSEPIPAPNIHSPLSSSA